MSKWLLGVKVLTVGGGRKKYGMGEGKKEPCVQLEMGIEDVSRGSLILIDADMCREHTHFPAPPPEEA